MTFGSVSDMSHGFFQQIHCTGRLTGNPGVIGSSVGLVSINAPAVTDQFAGEKPTFDE
jgi:hypothetical protein